MKYKARSMKISEVLKKLEATMKSSLAESIQKEEEAVATHEKLMKSKGAERASVEIALEKLVKENGARDLSKAEAQDEIDALQAELESGKKLVTKTREQLENKTTEWTDREKLRLGEMEAISKAIFILSNDDAKDMMTKSYESQGYSFMQKTDKLSHVRQAAARELRSMTSATGRDRLSALAALVNRSSHFEEVFKAIDKMVAVLKAEENTDLKNKEDCESSIAKNTRDAFVENRTVEELTDGIAKLEAEVSELDTEIETAGSTIAATEKQVKEAAEQRKAEHEEWEKSDHDDMTAKATVEKAKLVLESFYKENNLQLVQSGELGGVRVRKAQNRARVEDKAKVEISRMSRDVEKVETDIKMLYSENGLPSPLDTSSPLYDLQLVQNSGSARVRSVQARIHAKVEDKAKIEMSKMSHDVEGARADIKMLYSQNGLPAPSVEPLSRDNDLQLVQSGEARRAHSMGSRSRASVEDKAKFEMSKMSSEYERAKTEIKTLYSENGLSLPLPLSLLEVGQTSKTGHNLASSSTEMPESPPKTWEKDYKGRTDESTSILAILDIIMEDMAKDRASAKAAEDKAQAAFDEFAAESGEQIENLNEQISTLKATKAERQGTIADKSSAKSRAEENLAALNKAIADETKACEFLLVNYDMRVKNRQIEMDGLIKAKALLQGGEFNIDTDATREIKPGDAFLERRK